MNLPTDKVWEDIGSSRNAVLVGLISFYNFVLEFNDEFNERLNGCV